MVQWFDKHRKCDDGSFHFGELELITWEGVNQGETLGWGCCVLEECEELKETFMKEYNEDHEKFFKYWPQGYRWTCCAISGDMPYGCDHHGTGPKACTCDFCHMGKPLPNKLINPKLQNRIGLKLSQGPDPRSFNPVSANIDAMMRNMLGMDH